MVTHDVIAIPKMKKIAMKKIKNKKGKKKKQKKGSEKQESESDADNLDLNQKLYPLLHYVSDQEELVNQMFATIRGSKLEAMLPPVLKGIPLKELKKLCLHELRGMSKKRILCCINGQMMEGSSGSEDDDEEEKEEKGKTTNEGIKNEEDNNKGDKRKLNSDQIPKDFMQKKIKVEPGLEDSKEGGLGSDTGKSVLELLELEMRARIIKTMLEKGDDGKKIAEDAIAAVMQSAKQITKEDNQMRREKETVAKIESKNTMLADLKGDIHLKISEEQVISETRRGNKSTGNKDGKISHRHHRSRDRDRKETRRKIRDKREKSYSDDSSCCERKKRSKESISLERRVQKKKKITRKEFEERMKRAKKNRTYRQRKASEDEEKAKDKEKEKRQADEPNKDQENDDLESKKEDFPGEGEAIENKPTEEASGEVSEKEEGELDSNEEEEGACTPSNISSASDYSSSPSSRRRSYSSRSRSRSYSRSLSRSPSSRRRKRRWRRRSYTQSRSRSRSVEWKNRDESKRRYERKSREQVRIDSIGKKGHMIVPLGNQKQNKEEEENWGQKCDIEFVDSEEDFDDHPDTSKKDMLDKKLTPAAKGQIMERASISFSLQKKSGPNITPSIDLDDLPLKQSQVCSNATDNLSSDVGIIKTPKPTMEEEIVISSDSDGETQENVPLTVTSQRHKKLSDTKQANPKQTIPPLSKEETTESEVEVIKITDSEHEIDNAISECHPVKQGQSNQLNSERALDQIDSNRKDETLKRDEIKEGMEKNEVTNSVCSTAVKKSEVGVTDNIDRVKEETGKKENFNEHKQTYIHVEELPQSDEDSIKKSQQNDDTNIEKLNLSDDIDEGKPQQSGDIDEEKSQQSDDSSIKKPQQNDESDIKKVQQSDKISLNKPHQSDESGIKKPEQSDDSDLREPEQSDDNCRKKLQQKDDGIKKLQQYIDSGISKTKLNDDSGIKTPNQSGDCGMKKPQSDDCDLQKPQQSDDISTKKPQINDDGSINKPKENDDSGMKGQNQSNSNDEQSNTSGLQCQIIGFNQLRVSGKEEMKDDVHKVGKFDGCQTVDEDCFIVENKPQEIDPVGSECCRSETEPELTCSTQKLINRKEDNDLEMIDHNSVDMKGISKEVIPVLNERISENKNDSPCRELCVTEGNEGDDKMYDLTETFQEEMSLTVKERSMESSEKDMFKDKQQAHAQEDKEEMREQMLDTDNLTEAKKLMETDENDSVATEECLPREKIMEGAEEQIFQERSIESEDKHVGSVSGAGPTENFYRGAEHLKFSDDDRDDDCNIEEFTRSDSPVEPIRIETGLIRKSVLRQRKMEVVVPDKSWMKKEKKKKEKSKDTLVIEGIGLLTSTLSENAQGLSLKESEGETVKIDKPNTRMETMYGNVSSASETDSSLLAEDMTHNSSTIQSPKQGLEQKPTVSAPEEIVNYEDYEPKADEKLQKRTSQETEIIGVIETSKDSGSDNFDDFELEGSSWSMRWLQSEKVQKVVTSSKMLSRVRKKIQKKDKATKVVTMEKVEEPQKKTAEPLVPIIGSIEEYERLFGMKVKKDKDEASNSSSTSLQGTIGPEQSGHSSTAPIKVTSSGTAAPIFGSDDEGEDSEEEALWSKILGK